MRRRLHWPRWQIYGSHEDFLKYNYAETKDLSKHFLTLVSGLLVFSLTLSDKVVGFGSASWPVRLALVVAWASMLGAIIACGLGLVFITLAAGDAAYKGSSYLTIAARAYNAIVVAGALFILGLVLLIASATASLAMPSAPPKLP